MRHKLIKTHFAVNRNWQYCSKAIISRPTEMFLKEKDRSVRISTRLAHWTAIEPSHAGMFRLTYDKLMNPHPDIFTSLDT